MRYVEARSFPLKNGEWIALATIASARLGRVPARIIARLRDRAQKPVSAFGSTKSKVKPGNRSWAAHQTETHAEIMSQMGQPQVPAGFCDFAGVCESAHINWPPEFLAKFSLQQNEVTIFGRAHVLCRIPGPKNLYHSAKALCLASAGTLRLAQRSGCIRGIRNARPGMPVPT